MGPRVRIKGDCYHLAWPLDVPGPVAKRAYESALKAQHCFLEQSGASKDGKTVFEVKFRDGNLLGFVMLLDSPHQTTVVFENRRAPDDDDCIGSTTKQFITTLAKAIPQELLDLGHVTESQRDHLLDELKEGTLREQE